MTGTDFQTQRSVLQEYLGLLSDAADTSDPQTRDIRLLRAWGVLRYILSGPMSCEHCQTQVRLAIPVISERFSGETLEYACLCTNCTFKELERSHRVIMQVGNVRVEYPHEDGMS
jgi:hypothetical protein